MKFKHFLIAIGLLFPAICIAETIYEDARQEAIALYNNGEYGKAVNEFIAIQDIAPVNNDLSAWILKCNKQITLNKNHNKNSSQASRRDIRNGMATHYKSDSLGKFHHGLALIRQKDKFGYINKENRIVVPLLYDDVEIFGTTITHEYGSYIDTVSCKGDWGGVAMSVKRNDKWGFVDRTGIEIIPCRYDVVENFLVKDDKVIPVGIDSLYGYISNHGESMIPFVYEYAGRFKSGLAPVVMNNKLGFIDKEGNIVIDLFYDPIFEFNDVKGIAQVKGDLFFNDEIVLRKNGQWGLVNKSGEEVFPFIFDDYITSVLSGSGTYHILMKDQEKCYILDDSLFSEKEFENEDILRKIENGNTDAFFDMTESQRTYMKTWAENNTGSVSDYRKDRILGMILWSEGGYVNIERAFYSLKRSAESGDKVAQFYFGVMCEWGIVASNEKETVKQKKNKVYIHGDTPNYTSAIKWYQMSASQNYTPAQEKLKELENEGIK